MRQYLVITTQHVCCPCSLTSPAALLASATTEKQPQYGACEIVCKCAAQAHIQKTAIISLLHSSNDNTFKWVGHSGVLVICFRERLVCLSSVLLWMYETKNCLWKRGWDSKSLRNEERQQRRTDTYTVRVRKWVGEKMITPWHQLSARVTCGSDLSHMESSAALMVLGSFWAMATHSQ